MNGFLFYSVAQPFIINLWIHCLRYHRQEDERETNGDVKDLFLARDSL